MKFHDISYAVDGPLGVITLGLPQYKNAQGYRMLDEIDAAFDLAAADKDVRVLIVRGSGGNFSSGHDLGTPEGMEYRRKLGAAPGAENSPGALRFAKIQMNKAQDAQGFSRAVEDSFGDYVAMMNVLADEMRVEGGRRLSTVDLAVKGRKRERFGQEK